MYKRQLTFNLVQNLDSFFRGVQHDCLNSELRAQTMKWRVPCRRAKSSLKSCKNILPFECHLITKTLKQLDATELHKNGYR